MDTEWSPLHRVSLALVILLLAVLSLLPLVLPTAAEAAAPADQFSAGRAMADLAVIASEPHPAGSPAQERVRSYIVQELQALGLTAAIESHGQVSNIIVRLPGSDPSLAVLVTAHYDSASNTPGAGDDGTSTAAMLESIRVLHARGALRNDVILLFSDGEELGWLGAQAYIEAHHSEKEGVGALLVFDTRPGNAPIRWAETSPGDSWLVGQMRGLPLRLWAASWLNRQERTEQDTDFDAFQPAGYTGLVMENEATGIAYHTPLDSVQAVSPRLVQAFGDTMLMLIERFGDRDLGSRAQSADATYFTLPLAGLVVYPEWVTPALSIVGLAAWLALLFLGWKRRRLSTPRLLLAALGLLAGMVLITLAAQLAWSAVPKGSPQQLAAYGGFESSPAWLSGMMIAAAVLMMVLMWVLRWRAEGFNLAAGATLIYALVWAVLYFLSDYDNPLTTPNIAWPFLGAVLAMGVLLFTKSPTWKMALLAVSAFLVLMLAMPSLKMGTFTREDAWIPVLMTCVLVLALAPHVSEVAGSSAPQ